MFICEISNSSPSAPHHLRARNAAAPEESGGGPRHIHCPNTYSTPNVKYALDVGE